SLVLSSIALDDNDNQQHVKIPLDTHVEIKALHITDDIIATFQIQWITSEFIGQVALFYVEYSFEGEEIYRKEFTNILPEQLRAFDVLQVILTEAGNIVISTNNEQGTTLYLTHNRVDTMTSLELNIDKTIRNPNGVVVAKSDDVFALDFYENNVVIREIDFVNKKWGNTYNINCSITSALFSGGMSDFDFIISEKDYLYGYNTKSHEQTTLLNWLETGFVNSQDIFVEMLSDGNIVVILREINSNNHQETLVYLLSPFPRADVVERKTLTLGGLFITDEIQDAVLIFNQTNKDYQIIVKEYAGYDTDWNEGLTRLQMELMTGGGPDLIFNSYNILPKQGPYIDLYSLIDVDPDINREDFFPNILTAFENPDGTLTMFSNGFNIRTMVSTKEALGSIDKWTLSEMFKLAEKPPEMSHPFGIHLIRTMFISDIMRFSRMGFIDMQTYTANLDNEDFIQLLEISRYFSQTWADVGAISSEYPDEYLRLLRNEQLLKLVTLYDVNDFHIIAELLGNNLLTLGIPSNDGGIHIVETMNQIGINTFSDYTEGAWKFLRSFFLPTSTEQMEVTFGFPLRIDLFEAFIADAPYPHFSLDAQGNTIMIPPTYYLSDRTETGIQTNYEITLTTMTDYAKESLRTMITTARAGDIHYSTQLWDIIEGDLAAFYDGAKTTEETVRIIQSRLQLYLSEQQLAG
ncbi:MAG: hypothetical protein LBC73_09845, partial [Oscillospiraceae bacterium]|nr:hypothetical protein [Oscillospiraceae bacterium]